MERGDPSLSSGDEVLTQACTHAGLDARHARRLRAGTNALFLVGRRTPTARAAGRGPAQVPIGNPPIVVRVGAGSNAARIAEKEIRVAEWLAAQNVPAARPAAGIAQPLDIGGHPVTFWEWIPTDDGPSTPRELGDALRRLHALPPPRFELPRFDPLAGIDALLASTASVDPDLIAYLRDQCGFLKGAYRNLTFDLPSGPIHGDAHTANLMRSGGRAILIDFETFALGPREWDLTPTAVQRERFGLPEAHYRAFAEAYGLDVRDSPAYAIMRRIREVTITVWLRGVAARQRGALDEFGKRVASLRDERDGRVWRRH